MDSAEGRARVARKCTCFGNAPAKISRTGVGPSVRKHANKCARSYRRASPMPKVASETCTSLCAQESLLARLHVRDEQGCWFATR
jgi:hypothetical protein